MPTSVLDLPVYDANGNVAGTWRDTPIGHQLELDLAKRDK